MRPLTKKCCLVLPSSHFVQHADKVGHDSVMQISVFFLMQGFGGEKGLDNGSVSDNGSGSGREVV